MNQIYELEGGNIKVDLNPKLIRIYSNAELWHFLKGNTNRKLQLLITTIKQDYLHRYKSKLAITDDSLAVEIIVHVYCDYLGLKFNKALKFYVLNNLVNKLLKRAEIIDCGEKTTDKNRWLWNILSRFKGSIIKLIPEDLNKHNLKRY